MKVVFIVGTTATGKTKLAVECGLEFGGEILNGDSISVYESLIIGSARPTPEELKSVPHHLIGTVRVGYHYTAGEFRRDALKVLTDCNARNVKAVYVTGGSGFYLQALYKGMYDVPPISLEIRDRVRSLPPEDLWSELERLDPETAARLSPQDQYRQQRALEVCYQTGQSFHAFKINQTLEPFPFPHVFVGLRRKKEILKSAIQARAEQMIQDGLLDEARGLLLQGHTDWRALGSVGYKEAFLFLNGQLSKEDLIPAIVKSTMLLAKKQSTWFNKDPQIQWFDSDLNWIEAKAMVKISYE